MILYACSSNAGKLREFALAAPTGLQIQPLPGLSTVAAPEETGEHLEENAALKALYYSRFAEELVFADDSGLEEDALGGAPGVYSARYAGQAATDADNNALLLNRMEGISERQARFVCVIALAQQGKLLGVFHGKVEGEILRAPTGKNGFGYDPLFFFSPSKAAFGELANEEKFKVSHRGKALSGLDPPFGAAGASGCRHLANIGSCIATCCTTALFVKQASVSLGQTGYMTGWGVFSTLRVAEGVLFAFERHYRRMQHDAKLLRVPFHLSAEDLHAQLQKLIQANQAWNATLRVSVVRNRGGAFEGPDITQEADLVAFTTDLKNWTPDVKLSYVPHGRYGASPYAGAKVISWAQNLVRYEDAHERGFDEVVLLNEDGMVSECTSANIFMVTGDNEVLTPPLHTSGCLPGVTRALLLEEITLPGYTIREAEISPSQLETAKQVFITSSTRDLLPVASVDGLELEQSPTQFQPLQKAFASLIAAYVGERSRNVVV